ncbi:MAG: hypothetical protein M3Y87_17400, partial [Myxococcota bacterium]|nr:hypothetical protein [Myxococcota bacterium]
VSAVRARIAAALIALVTIVADAGCDAALRPLASTMCHESRPGASTSGAESATPEEPTDAEWIALLTDDEEGPSSSCEVALARTPPQIPRCRRASAGPAPALLAIPPRIAARLHRSGDDDLLWIATHQTGDGMRSGPLAVVRRTALGLEVQALGTHLGPAEHAELRMLRTGAATVVAVEADSGGARIAQLLIQSGGALVPAALDDPEGGCSAPAQIVLRRADETRRSDGWTRRAVRTAVLDESDDAVLVREHLTVRELDLADADAPPRATHDADAIRRLVPAGARLRADRAALMAPTVPSAERASRASERR